MTRDEAVFYIALEKSYIEDIPGSDNTVKALEMAIEALKQVEQKKGKWINPSGNPEFVNKEFFHDCSVCGYTVMNKSNFCSSCGAKMEE